MIIEKSFRALMSPAYDPVESAVATDEEAIDRAHLNTDLRSGQDILPVFDEDYWPRTLTLRVRMIPVSFQEGMQNISATFISNETPCTATPFYDRAHQTGALLDHCYAGVDLVYGGTGSLGEESSVQFFTGVQMGAFQLLFFSEKPDLIYQKIFPTQRAQSIVCSQRHLGAGQWSIATHAQKQLKINEMPIFAYGGIYQHRAPLDSVMPIYATLSGSNTSITQITLRSQKFWHEKGIFEGQSIQLGDTIYTFHDLIPQEMTLSLGATITSGRIKVSLGTPEERKIYKSQRSQAVSSTEGFVDITFVPIE